MSQISNNNFPIHSVTTTVVESKDSSKETPLPNPIAASISTDEPPTDRYLKLKQGASVLAKKISQAITKFLDMALNDKKPTANTAARTQVTQQASSTPKLGPKQTTRNLIASCRDLLPKVKDSEKRKQFEENLGILGNSLNQAGTIKEVELVMKMVANMKGLIENAAK